MHTRLLEKFFDSNIDFEEVMVNECFDCEFALNEARSLATALNALSQSYEAIHAQKLRYELELEELSKRQEQIEKRIEASPEKSEIEGLTARYRKLQSDLVPELKRRNDKWAKRRRKLAYEIALIETQKSHSHVPVGDFPATKLTGWKEGEEGENASRAIAHSKGANQEEDLDLTVAEIKYRLGTAQVGLDARVIADAARVVERDTLEIELRTIKSKIRRLTLHQESAFGSSHKEERLERQFCHYAARLQSTYDRLIKSFRTTYKYKWPRVSRPRQNEARQFLWLVDQLTLRVDEATRFYTSVLTRTNVVRLRQSISISGDAMSLNLRPLLRGVQYVSPPYITEVFIVGNDAGLVTLEVTDPTDYSLSLSVNPTSANASEWVGSGRSLFGRPAKTLHFYSVSGEEMTVTVCVDVAVTASQQ